MGSRTLERFTLVCAAVAFVAFVISPILVVPAVHESVPPPVLIPLASSLLLALFAVQISFLLIQFVPDGRRVIRLPVLGGDGWLTILVATMMPALCWNDLVPLADPSFSWLHFQFSLPLFQAIAFAMARLYQLRRMGVA